MDKRTQTILNWCVQYRPDTTGNVKTVLTGIDEKLLGIQQLISVAFEAGRHFQKNNPGSTGYPNDYAKDEEQRILKIPLTVTTVKKS